ncbi:CHD3-type chromatin-remodeling factor PICKLE-like [Lycium ferocissimum]|uniref:CHD3-type chromatin-remodeling factor PICKLE-like n=1 Tax=Lycium ferocissimum TaxID=112874 RepID=UPI00281638CB|nr:CHD3-type chromatin-remodeling factor PICKLE-like [Lycium ferocissimum]XP_059290028.1 CHD3-type chromatin-remodeling factor PICKLE-like [Lycium ferocissimum]XP_059290029.1 CHD3-type chromatin-remodeling factor PICKLE-like [Lycium ferocissimum]
MASLVERLRVRSDRRPIYNLDESDDEADMKPGKSRSKKEDIEKIVRSDVKKESCQACGGDSNLLYCETCNYAYHPKCLVPPLKAPLPSSWRCPECVSPLNDIDKILDCETRPTVADDKDASKLGSKQVFVKQYLVKWKGLSYLHCTWVPEKEFVKAYKAYPRLKTKVNNFHRQMSSMTNSEDEYVAIRPEWTTVDRILARRGDGEEKEYLVKWKELPYDECYWEFESDISSFLHEIERYHTVQSRRKKSSSKQKGVATETTESNKKSKEFQQYESSPEFLSGGSLHPYQLEGLNFLRFAWSKQTHVILADEMGLGKTIQSIAFLASLFKENLSPHLVVAPLSTLRNWEREFATWAPQMNVVMYVGGAQARTIIREYEFFFPKNLKKTKKKKSGQIVGESKQDRIKFDVLLTSYEMIIMDSASLKPIKWECMIVDEGHRLKNKDSKLFSSLKQYSTRHRVLLTGTPLQNNLDELFMLMHFLDAGKFGSLEEFQQEFEDISQEEQVSRLHKMLAPHLLRRVKKDVMTELPPKKELILRVELSSKQKEYYKAILTRNFQILTRKGGAQISLINVVMELRKLCCHPFMLEGVEPEDTNEFNKQLLESSGKLQLLDKMMVRLKEQGHRVLIYSQFQHMLDLLEDYCNYRKWQYERIDGKVGGAERQIRIDRFNAKNSSRFCFLLSTRAGGLGINLATADTVIIYDSDWNPHADLQAMARAHRLGQTNKVMIFRLISRGTIEERMMQMTKKKMILEHLVVGRLKAQNINQEELDDIIRYGSKELFADDNDEAGKSRQIHYDDAAIDRLLDREQVRDEDTAVNDEEDDSFLKAFKVANFEYVEEAEATAEEEAPTAPVENKATVNNSERATYWEELLRDKYEVHQVEEFNAMGKGKRSRKQMVSVEDDDLAGLEDVSTDGEDDNYEAEADSSDGETASSGAPVVRKAPKKKARVDSVGPLPLMEGEGRSFRVLGFNQSQRAAFVQILMRFGIGEFDWAEFTPRLKQKTYEEIKDYGALFLSHIAEDITDSPTFSDGVPKEGLRIQDVLVRIAVLLLIRDKVKAFSEKTGGSLFAGDIVSRFPGLKGGKLWKEEHDLLLLRAVLKHGYGRWQAIVDDKELRIQEIICKELNLPFINLPVPGASQPQVPPTPGPSQELPASGVSQAQANVPGASQAPHGVNTASARSAGGQVKATGDGNTYGAELSYGTSDPSNRPQVYQDSSSSYHFREMQRRQVEFIKKRVLLLEKGLNAEYQKEVFGDEKSHELPNEEMVCDTKVTDEPNRNVEEANTEMIDHFPRLVAISPQGISQVACDGKPDRLGVAELYNKMCQVLSGRVQDSVNEGHPTSGMGKNILPLEVICQQMNQILSSPHQNTPNFERKLVQEDQNSEASKSTYPVPSSQVDDRVLNAEKEHGSLPKKSESESKSASSCTAASMTESHEHHNVTPAKISVTRPSSLSTGEADTEMVDHTDISTSNV